jgi:hypothetical protein
MTKILTDDSDKRHETGTNLGAEQPNFPFSGKLGLNIDSEDPNSPLEYSELFITSELAELISRETNKYAQKFLENMLKLKIRSRIHHWNNTEKK